jgi:hypothetical protein
VIRWSRSREIGWSRFHEIAWSLTFEIGWSRPGEILHRTTSWSAAPASDGRNSFNESNELSHVVAVSPGNPERKRCPPSVGK